MGVHIGGLYNVLFFFQMEQGFHVITPKCGYIYFLIKDVDPSEFPFVNTSKYEDKHPIL